MADKYYRLICLVVDICADVLRKYFVKLAKTDAGITFTSVDAYLSHRKRDVMQLFNNKKLRRDQYDLLYPRNGTADENQWDTPILVTLITELFATHLQPLVIVALEIEIRGIRNELQHYPNTRNISNDHFNDYWERLDSSVRLIATNALDTNDQASLQEKINQVKCNHLPNLGDCLRIWHEETSKQLLNIMNEVQGNAEETNSILRQVTVQKPGPSGDKNKRIKVADDILARLQAGFESTIKELSGDFNPPSEVTDIRAKLRDYHHVVVTGCNNSRYFDTALAAIKGMNYNYKRSVEMHTSSDWRHIDPEDVDLVLCRDPFGGFSYDESKAKAMSDIFKSMVHSTKRNNGDKALDIVIVTDLTIMEECKMHHDHELLDEVVKVFTDTSSTQPADLTIGCRGQGQYAQSSSLPLIRNNLGAMTEYFLKVNKIYSCQVDDEILKKAKKSFQKYKAIVLTGRKKCGKTSIAVALASAYKEQECLLLKKPHDIDKIDFPNICLVIIDEFAGKYRYEENEAYEWYNMFDHLYNAVVAGQMNVIITCEKDKLEKCIKEIGRHAILDHVVDVTLQNTVVKLEVTEQYGHVSGQKITTDHYVGTISNTTQTLNYTSSLLADPSQGPIPLSRHDTIPISTGNTSILGRAQTEGIQNPMQLKRGFSGMESFSLSFETKMDDDCSSDEDLPVGLTPLKLEKTPSENDIVWVKWKKWPHLPALVRKVYKKKKRVTCAVFFPTGFEEDFTLSYGNQGAVIPFCDPKKDEILESAKDLSSVDRAFFRACLAEAQNYMTKEALKGLRKPEPLKENITQEEEPEDIKDDNCEEENEEKITPYRKRRKMSDCIVTKVENNGLSKQGQERVEKRKLKTRPLIDFLISDTTKDFLEKIFNGTTKSELHDNFLTGTIRERAKMKHRGFVPIDDDEQIELLLSTYLTWIKQINKNIHLDDVNYVFDVWVPEAVVFALKKVNGYSRKRAWERFHIGKYRLRRFECKEIDGKGVRFMVSRRETHQNQ